MGLFAGVFTEMMVLLLVAGVGVLDGRKEFLPELKMVEQSVARIFGTSLMDSKGCE